MIKMKLGFQGKIITTEKQILCALYLLGRQGIIRRILPKYNVRKEWVRAAKISILFIFNNSLNEFWISLFQCERHFYNKEEKIGLEPFQVGLFKFLETLTKAKAEAFFRSFPDLKPMFDLREPYEITLLRLVQMGSIRPKTRLDDYHISMLQPDSREFLLKATSKTIFTAARSAGGS